MPNKDKDASDELKRQEQQVKDHPDPVAEVRLQELQAAEDLKKKPDRRPVDKILEKAKEDAALQKKAELEHKEYMREAMVKRREEAEKLEIGPTHPLHPRNMSNPSNPTSPVTHDPTISAAVDLFGEGEP